MGRYVDRNLQQQESQAPIDLNAVVNIMVRRGALSDFEALILHELIYVNNDYVAAAYELYEHDGDLTELQDTLMR